MTAADLVGELRRSGVTLWVDGENLRYRAPRGALTPDLRDELLSRKSEIIALLRESGQGTAVDPNELAPRGDVLPLASIQERLWFLEQLTPGNTAYNVAAAWHLEGPLDTAALRSSLDAIVERHEVLRTACISRDGRPGLALVPPSPVTLSETDLRARPRRSQEGHALELLTHEARRPFDLAQAPLLRAHLFRMSDETHLLLIATHHFVADGWSMGILFRELSEFYRAQVAGEPVSLPDLPLQYCDFAYQAEQQMERGRYDEQLAYWKRQLDGVPPLLDLPMDHPRPPVWSYRGAIHSFGLSPDLTRSLRALSREEGSTLFLALFTAFQVLLHRLTQRDDMAVGTTASNRNRREAEELIGSFANSLVIRTDLSGDPTFRDLLGRVSEVAWDAFARQDLPFERLVEALQLDRNLAANPLYQVSFLLHQLPTEHALRLPGVTAREIPVDLGTAKEDLLFILQDRGEELTGIVEYSTDLFEAASISRMVSQYQVLLEGIVAAPDRPVRAYPLVTSESRALLPDPAATLPEPHYESFTSLVAQWARKTPDEPAVMQDSRSWTYRELAETAQTLTEVLSARGVERGDVVAVSGPRCFGLIAAMLATFRSGGVLLPVAPELPPYRKRLMLREAKPALVVDLSDRIEERQDSWAPLPVIHVDRRTGEVLGGSREGAGTCRFPEPCGDDLAYIFFTSGTTGVPKGVLGSHKGLSHFLAWQRQTFSIGPSDRVAQLTNLSFDPILRDVFLPLTSGATLCLPADGHDLEPGRVLSWLDREGVSVLHIVPAVARHWLSDVPQGVSLKALRYVFLAGEPLTDDLVLRWRRAFPQSGEIVNLYGPTETTMVKCYYRVPPDFESGGGLPAGRPMPQTQALILGAHDQLCGIGEIGEICLRTPFMTLGYINAPEENERRFVRNPFRNDERDLLFRTGDRGRYRSDGTIEVLSRLDDQVKIRGVRVEPLEIESVLEKHPEIVETVVLARDDGSDDKRLVAYVVPRSESRLTDRELRSFLARELPTYMMPSCFVFLDAIPLTPNGKVDRRALPTPDVRAVEPLRPPVAARTPAERTLFAIWSEVLGSAPAGVHDNFFESGGHSLLAVQVIVRVRDALGVEVPLTRVFEAPTIAELAEEVEKAALIGVDSSEPELVPLNRERLRANHRNGSEADSE